ncbi:MAG: aldo/keto reductase [Patulibacter sp.]
MSLPLAPTVTLRHGAEMPQLGLGTWPMNDAEAEQAVATAIQSGYRLVDTAFNYGNEVGVGRGIAASGVPRSEIFITTKLNREDHGIDEVRRAFERSATKLGVDTIDLFMIHWPNPDQGRYVEAYQGLVQLLGEGLIRAIGLSNFKPDHIDRVVAATDVLPDVDQIELDPTQSRPDVRAYLSQHGIVCEAWSPLGGQSSDLRNHPTIARIAEAHGKTPAQIVLRWHMAIGNVTMPKSADPERQRQNLDIFGFQLTDAEVHEIDGLDDGDSRLTDSDKFGH